MKPNLHQVSGQTRLTREGNMWKGINDHFLYSGVDYEILKNKNWLQGGNVRSNYIKTLKTGTRDFWEKNYPDLE